MTNTKKQGYAAIIFVCLGWGYSFIATKICYQWFTPFSLAIVRFILISVILFALLMFKEKSIKIKKEDRLKMFLAGFVGFFLHFLVENIAIDNISASLASILISSVPAFAVVFDRIIIKAPITKIKLLSVVISILGVILVVGFDISESGNIFLGSFLMLMSALTLVIHSHISVSLQKKYSPLKITFYQCFIGAFFFSFFAPFTTVNLEGFNASGLINFLFLALVCSGMCYTFYNYAIKALNIMICSIFVNLLPVVTIFVGVFALGETVTPVQLGGTAMILLSVFLISFSK